MNPPINTTHMACTAAACLPYVCPYEYSNRFRLLWLCALLSQKCISEVISLPDSSVLLNVNIVDEPMAVVIFI